MKLQLFYEIILLVIPYTQLTQNINIKYGKDNKDMDPEKLVQSQINSNVQDIINCMKDKYFNKNIVKHNSKCMCTKCRKLGDIYIILFVIRITNILLINRGITKFGILDGDDEEFDFIVTDSNVFDQTELNDSL